MPIELPPLGLGTWQNDDPEECAATVRDAIDMGYRHIDTAQGYGNEEAVGEGIAAADVDRDEVFVATKVSTGNLAPEDVKESTRISLEKLGLEYVDLLYIHWPLRTYEPASTLPAFDELVDEGLIRHVGVSNFEPDQLDEARRHLDAPIAANQVEMHPLCPQRELRAYGREHDHWVVAYSPLARGAVFDHPVIAGVAEEVGAHPAQVTLAWLFAQDHVGAIPKATGEAHLRDNLAATDLSLSEDQLERIDAIEDRQRVVNPAHAPWNR